MDKFNKTTEAFEESDEEDFRPAWKKVVPLHFKREAKIVFKIALPVILTNIFQYTILTESILMCGHLSKLELDGVALAISMVNAFGLSVSVGLCTACDTLFSTVFGSKDKKQAGLILQRSIMIISLAPLFMWPLYVLSEPFFYMLGQDQDVSRIASSFMQIFMPGLLCHMNYYIFVRFMQNQNYTYIPLIIGIIGNVFNVVVQYITIYQLNLGYKSAAAVQAASYFLMWMLALFYVICSGMYKKSWDGIKSEALFDWNHFLRLAIPGIGHYSAEVLCWEICTFISGILGTTELAAQSIIYQTQTIVFMIPLGIGIALNIRVGQCLGGMKPRSAKRAFHVTLYIVVMLGCTMAICFLLLRNYIPYIFTSDLDAVNEAASIFPVIAVITILNHVNAACAGALRGCGRQIMGAMIIILAYYIFALPFAVIFSLVLNLRTIGLWLGILVGLFVGQICNLTIIYRQDWHEQAEIAQERLRKRAAFNETTSLLTDIDNGTSHSVHRRTPSEPYGCSTEVVKLVPSRGVIPKEKVRQMAFKRLFTLFVLLGFLGSSVLIYYYIPVELYRHKKNNGTQIYNDTVVINLV